ncbi:hypothetical protein AC579_8193 [Pseudocercospora musae]|uniref:Uncharacterized protein n=1 Tax=Pseudocercospora musae TaxID=113226 RepID=A0A139IUM7_9PEZI|nr:hypothetical protein AC579_8193 [Pseudocercospora musae]
MGQKTRGRVESMSIFSSSFNTGLVWGWRTRMTRGDKDVQGKENNAEAGGDLLKGEGLIR